MLQSVTILFLELSENIYYKKCEKETKFHKLQINYEIYDKVTWQALQSATAITKWVVIPDTSTKLLLLMVIRSSMNLNTQAHN